MRYMLLISSDGTATAPPPAAETERLLRGHQRLAQELRDAGKMVVGERLRPAVETTRVRLKAGQHQVMDGPFAETKEVLGGFYLIECASKEEALDWARKVPLREDTFVEVRPVWQM